MDLHARREETQKQGGRRELVLPTGRDKEMEEVRGG